jgi:hypothetical protein
MAIPVSGPGKFSQRTDKQAVQNLPNPDYGEGKAYKQLEQSAPMAQAQGLPGGTDFASLFGNPADRVTPLSAPSAQPNTPVTDGAALGPGAGAPAPPANDAQKQRIQSYMPFLEWMANQPGSSDSARNLVRQMKYSQ